MPRRGCFEWGQHPDWEDSSTRHDSGRSFTISTNSRDVIFLVSFGGTEVKPGRLVSCGVKLAPVDVAALLGLRGIGDGVVLLTSAKAAEAKVSRLSDSDMEKTGSAASRGPDGPAGREISATQVGT